MKNSTLSAIAAVLSTVEFENKTEVIAEVEKELNRGAAVKAEKAAVYEAAKPVVFAVFEQTDSPLTVAEIWEAIEDEVPAGFTKSKLSYGLTHNWAAEVIKVEGKVNAYRKA